MEHEKVRAVEQSERTRRFVRNMRLLRDKRGWSAQRLSDVVAEAFARGEVDALVPRSIVANLENFRRENITLDEALALAHVLETSLGWLADSDGPACVKCLDNPPEGYACKTCGADEDVRVKPHG